MATLVRTALLLMALSIATTAHAGPSPHLVDLHVDLAYQIHVHGRHIDDGSAPTSPERVRRGNVRRVVLPLFVTDAWKLTPAEARTAYEATYRSLIDAVRSDGTKTWAEPGSSSSNGVRGLLAFEGADGFADDPNTLLPWIKRGACLIGLVHTRTNALAGSSSDPRSKARTVGLTARGERLVRFTYQHDALIDIAHASDQAVDHIAAIASQMRAPLVCSHTGVRARKNIHRNISDQQLAWIAASNGVVGIDLHSGHIGSKAGERATLDDFVEHLEHAVRVAGIDHVAIGSDLDGGIVEPIDSDGAATWPRLVRKLELRGWTPVQIEKVFHRNAERVLSRCMRRSPR